MSSRDPFEGIDTNSIEYCKVCKRPWSVCPHINPDEEMVDEDGIAVRDARAAAGQALRNIAHEINYEKTTISDAVQLIYDRAARWERKPDHTEKESRRLCGEENDT